MITCRNGPALLSTYEHRAAHLFTPTRSHSLSSSILALAAFVLSGAALRQPPADQGNRTAVFIEVLI